jgi:hypothetical protein
MSLRIALLAAVWIVGGCTAAAPSGDPGPSNQPTVQPSAAGGPGGTGSASPGSDSLPASVLDPVLAEIARIAAVPVDQVTVVSAESVTFPDGGLGCPQPGVSYTQALVDGYKIVATAGGTTYDYRGTGSTFRRCIVVAH